MKKPSKGNSTTTNAGKKKRKITLFSSKGSLPGNFFSSWMSPSTSVMPETQFGIEATSWAVLNTSSQDTTQRLAKASQQRLEWRRNMGNHSRAESLNHGSASKKSMKKTAKKGGLSNQLHEGLSDPIRKTHKKVIS